MQGNTNPSHPARDDRVDAFAHELRRKTVRVLQGADGPVSLGHLAAELTYRRQADAETVPADPERITRQLHHVHLPKLADVGLVTYAYGDGRNRVTVIGSPDADDLRALARSNRPRVDPLRGLRSST